MKEPEAPKTLLNISENCYALKYPKESPSGVVVSMVISHGEDSGWRPSHPVVKMGCMAPPGAGEGKVARHDAWTHHPIGCWQVKENMDYCIHGNSVAWMPAYDQVKDLAEFGCTENLKL